MNQDIKDSVFIFGCGYLGTRLAEVLVRRGYRVGALTRNTKTANKLSKIGIQESIVSQLESEDWHSRIQNPYSVVLNCVSSAGGGIEGYRSSYLAGQQSILSWAKGQSIRSYMYTSSTSVYPSNDSQWVDETTPTYCDSLEHPGSILVESENCLIDAQSRFDQYFIFRLSGIYGPSRHYLLDQISRNSVITGTPSHYMNMIHVDDIVGTLEKIISGTCKVPSGVYNVSDDEPVLREVLAKCLAEKLKVPNPSFDTQSLSKRYQMRNSKPKNRRISNRKIRAFVDLTYPTYREGYQTILAQY